MGLTCSGRSKLRDSLHQWESLTVVSTALVVMVVLVRTSIVRAVVLCSRSVGLIDPGTAAPACYGQPRKVTHEPYWSVYSGYSWTKQLNSVYTIGFYFSTDTFDFLTRGFKTVFPVKLLWNKSSFCQIINKRELTWQIRTMMLWFNAKYNQKNMVD